MFSFLILIKKSFEFVSTKFVYENLKLDENTVDEIRKKIGIVFQNPDNQFVGVTVKDDIAFGLENKNVSREEMFKRINEYLKLVSMEEFIDRSPEELSGGQKQRVAIAGALAMETELMIFDESTSMLDPKGTKEVNQMIKQIKNDQNKKPLVYTARVKRLLLTVSVLYFVPVLLMGLNLDNVKFCWLMIFSQYFPSTTNLLKPTKNKIC